MKESILLTSLISIICYLTACNGEEKTNKLSLKENTPKEITPIEYTILQLPTVDIKDFSKDSDNWIVLFDGKTLNGWRGYNQTTVPERWTIEENTIKLNNLKIGNHQNSNTKDLIFAHKFKNFELEFEWKVAKGADSGLLLYIQEIEGKPSSISASEYQIIDNDNHPDAKLGKNGNHKSASLYDMVPAKPPKVKPSGEWNKGKIICFKGSVIYYLNNVPVVEYHLWTSQWKTLLDNSKFSKDKCPLAYQILMNCGGDEQEGFIGLQDQQGEVWFQNIRIKTLD